MDLLKTKIVWLCHFSNGEIKKHFDDSNVNEFAPWITLLIDLISNDPNIELHIVAPNIFTNVNTNFNLNNVHYHFFKYLPFNIAISTKTNYLYFLLNKISAFLNITNFIWIKPKVKKIINEINPDLIHLHGTENPYYSVGILPFFNVYPTIISIQGFIRNAYDPKSIPAIIRVKVEEIILKKAINFGVRAKFMTGYLSEFNSTANYFWMQYPYTKPIIEKNDYSECDIVFFGRVCKEKGIEDLILALPFIAKKIKAIKLRIIGISDGSYKSYLTSLAIDNNIINNIEFVNFLTTQQELHNLVSKSKVCVLPTYDDIYSGTIVESMYMKIPVIAYKIPGLLDLQNETDDSIVFVEKGNIEELSNKIFQVLTDNELQKTLKLNAFNKVSELFDDSTILDNLVKSYNLIMHNFKRD